MTREKKKAPAPVHGVAAAARRAKMERAQQYSDTVWRNLNPLKAPPKMKHRSYFEAVENADKKKKKLEFEITTKREPPPGFEFIPTGHPELSQECKEQSRDRDAMFFIVSNSKDTLKLDHHMNRLGYHFRHSIVEEARKALKERGYHDQASYVHEPGKPEPIPNSQREIDQEADAVLRDLFPRIPNTDRQEIIDHAFKKDGMFNGEVKVGMAKDITLARRVQLAALAHIRHTHTRYDKLLKESDWANARKAVEKPCLDIIVKWRGDEETGRDQLDEILREVIEISDTESESEDERSGIEVASPRVPLPRSAGVLRQNRAVSRLSRAPNRQPGADSRTCSPMVASPHTPNRLRELTRAERRTVRKTQQRFKRYAAAAEALANPNQSGHQEISPEFVATPIEVVRSQGSVHPVDSYHTTPNTVREAYIPRISYGHTEIQRIPIDHSNGDVQDRMLSMPYDSHGHREQFIRVPDDQRPKVGPYSANYGHPLPPPPLSPVRLGLQDMLLPSIEPMSPVSAQVTQDASQQSMDARVIPRTIAKPVTGGSRPQLLSTLVNDDNVVAKRRRITTYFPEDFQDPPGSSYVRVAPRSQDDALHRPQIEYIAEQRIPAPSVQERTVYQDIPWIRPSQDIRAAQSEVDSDRSRTHPIPVNGNDPSPMGPRAPERPVYQSNLRVPAYQQYPVNQIEASLRSRAHPIAIDREDDYEPRRVVEIRGSPAHEIYRRSGSPRGTGVRSPHSQGDFRIRDPSSRVIYVDESTGRVTNTPSNQHRVIPRSPSGHPVYQEMPRALSPDMSRQRRPQSRTLERPMRYTFAGHQEALEANELERVPLAQSGAISRGIQAPLAEAPRLERFTRPQQHEYQPRPDAGVVQQALPQQYRDNVTYREARPDVIRSPGMEYERGPQQPFPVHPAPSSYVEIRGPPAHRRMPDHRDIIYVE